MSLVRVASLQCLVVSWQHAWFGPGQQDVPGPTPAKALFIVHLLRASGDLVQIIDFSIPVDPGLALNQGTVHNSWTAASHLQFYRPCQKELKGASRIRDTSPIGRLEPMLLCSHDMTAQALLRRASGLKAWLLRQGWSKLSKSDLQRELQLLDLEPAIGFWDPKQRISAPVLKAAGNMPGNSSAAPLSYKELFVGSPFQVQVLRVAPIPMPCVCWPIPDLHPTQNLT